MQTEFADQGPMNGASSADFQRALEHRRDDAVEATGRETAAIQAKAAATGSLGSGRLALRYMRVTDDIWRPLVDGALSDLGRYEAAGVPRDPMLSIAREVLTHSLDLLRTASRIDAPNSAWGWSQSAMNAVEKEWSKLLPYMELRLREAEIGVADEPHKASSIVYSITAETITGPIQQGSHGSTQVVATSNENFFAELETKIHHEVANPECQAELVALARDMQATRGTSAFLAKYQRFMEAAANHVSVLAPFLPALAKMLTDG